jgi:predicted esterase
VWLAHGRRDKPSYSEAKETKKWLSARLRAPVILQGYATGHEVSRQQLEDLRSFIVHRVPRQF